MNLVKSLLIKNLVIMQSSCKLILKKFAENSTIIIVSNLIWLLLCGINI